MKKLILLISFLITCNFTLAEENINSQESSNIKQEISKENKEAKYIVISTAGNILLDIYKLNNTTVHISEEGVNFKHPTSKTEVFLQGNIKVLKNPSNKEWNKYIEYHFDEEFCSRLK